ncbi:MAG: glycosyltransferase family 4 protein [Patescibacteria group bacterium]
MLRICYFGIYDPEFSRNKIYMRGLRENGVDIIECSDRGRGLRKFWNLFFKHWHLRNKYDVMIVGYPGYIIVPFARLITKKPVVFDALCSFYEAQIISRNAYAGIPFRIAYVRFIDWLANICADLIFVETDKQRQYYIDTLGVPEKKVYRVLIGVDDHDFYFDSSVRKNERFTVIFRGRLTKEAGVRHILDAAKILEGRGVDFVIAGFGFGDVIQELENKLALLKLSNVTLIPRQLPIADIRSLMLRSHISLGQFEDNERLKRTIPHKAFESLAMRLPYITANTEGVLGVLKDGENCLMVRKADPAHLAEKILFLKNNPSFQKRLIEEGVKTYRTMFTPKILGSEIYRAISGLVSKK